MMTPSTLFFAALIVISAPVVLTLYGVSPVLALIPTGVVFSLAIIDWFLSRERVVNGERHIRTVLSVGAEYTVSITVTNASARRLAITLSDEPPEPQIVAPSCRGLRVDILPGRSVIASYSATPVRRGRHEFGKIWIGHLSALRFWRVLNSIDCPQEIQVYPNIEAIHRFELLARVNSLDEVGIRTIRMKGEGTEFERLRDYRQGDEPRRVDWKTTAKRGKLIVREMGKERNQNILLMIDMGRMMRQHTGGMSHFDYALNTGIILSHIASKRGDNVGAIIFSDRVKRAVPLGRGRATVDAIVRAGYDIEPEPVATSYENAFEYVGRHVKKRSLLVLMTHMVPGEEQSLMQGYLTMLGRQHLPLCLFFREPALEEQIATPPAGIKESFHYAAAADILLDRAEGINRLKHGRVMAFSALPGELSTVAIGQYLDIKARNLL